MSFFTQHVTLDHVSHDKKVKNVQQASKSWSFLNILTFKSAHDVKICSRVQMLVILILQSFS